MSESDRNSTVAPDNRSSTAVDDRLDFDPGISDGLEIASSWTSAFLERIQISGALAIAEVKLAGSSFLLMMFLSVVSAVFALTAWGITVSAVILGLLKLGVPVWLSMAAMGVAHAIAAFAVFLRIRTLSQTLGLPETQRQVFSTDEESTGSMERTDGRL